MWVVPRKHDGSRGCDLLVASQTGLIISSMCVPRLPFVLGRILHSQAVAERTPAREGATDRKSLHPFRTEPVLRRRRNTTATAKATGGRAVAPEGPSQAFAERFIYGGSLWNS
jgi:hypothetical protein